MEVIFKCCKDCAHSIFDEQWGEYKCKIAQHVVYDVDRLVASKIYIHKKKVKTEEAYVEET